MSKMFPLTLRTDDHEIQLHADGTVTGDVEAMRKGMKGQEDHGHILVGGMIWLVMQVLDLRKKVDELADEL